MARTTCQRVPALQPRSSIGSIGRGRCSFGTWTSLVVTLAILALAGGFHVACRRPKVEHREGPPDGWKSPYVESAPKRASLIPKTPQGKAVTREVESERQTQTARIARADYPLVAYEKLVASQGEESRQLFALLKDPAKGLAALRLAKKRKKLRSMLPKALHCSDTNVRAQAALVVAKLRRLTPAEKEALVEALRGEPNDNVRAFIARAFVVIRSEKAVPVLKELAIRDESAEVRANAAWALGNQRDRSAVPILLKLLDDADTWVRLRAVSALKKVGRGNGEVERKLEKVAKSDRNRMVRERAREVLRRLK